MIRSAARHLPLRPLPLRAALSAAAVASALVLSACGGSDGDSASSPTTSGPTPSALASTRILNTKKVEQAIVASIKAQRDLTATVTCPAGVKQVRGATFDCVSRFRVSGKKGRQRAVFTVTQGTNGNVTYVAK